MNASYVAGLPVAMGTAAKTTTTVMGNMILQERLGIARYTRAMRIGTWMLVISICQMVRVGPRPRGDDVDALVVASSRPSQAWSAALLLIVVAAAVGVHVTRGNPARSSTKIFLWSLLMGDLGCLTDNLSVFFGLLTGQELAIVVVCFSALASWQMWISVKAPTRCDAAVYAPMQVCCELMLKMLTGMLMWGDSKRVRSLPIYILTFVFSFLGIILVSDTSRSDGSSPGAAALLEAA